MVQKSTIKLLLQGDLPGEKAQLEMFTLGRKGNADVLEKNGDFRESAVALVLFEEQETLKSILLQRPNYNGYHSNQIALPGGKRETFDTDLQQTALRECMEETGLLAPYFEPLGKLSHLYIPVSKFKVQPYVFFYHQPPIFHPDQREVADLFTFPIGLLLKDEYRKTKRIRLQNGLYLNDVPCFSIKSHTVWGATAIVLNEFRHLLMQEK